MAGPFARSRNAWGAFAVSVAVGTVSCSSSSAPEVPPRIEFSTIEVNLGTGRDARVTVNNPGEVAVGPVVLTAGAIRDGAGIGVPGSEIQVVPAEIPTLNPGGSTDVVLLVALAGSTQPGDYDAVVSAQVLGGPTASLTLRFRVDITAPPQDGGEIVISSATSVVRQGDAAGLIAEVRDAGGTVLSGIPVAWSVIPGNAGYVTGNGQFVGYAPGDVRVVASAGSIADTVDLSVTARSLDATLTVIGRGVESHFYTSDLWVHGDYAYMGTWSIRVGGGAGMILSTWSVQDPTQPVRTGALTLDARTVNDVKVRSDGQLALATHEVSFDGKNGVTLLSLAEPSRPEAVSRITEGLESGVHNAWLEGNYAYLAVDGGSADAGLRVLDVSDPTNPRPVASFYAGSSFLHDVYVRDGLAFLSHWNAGLIILDVGNGIAGGSPTNPIEVSRIKTTGGQTHNAWYWPEAGYVFVGEEDFSVLTPGIMHVVDVGNLAAPREVATYRIAGSTPHNFWLDEGRGVLYVAWYEEGIRVLDVTGDLLGELERQGREYAGLIYDGTTTGCSTLGPESTCSWAPQLHDGHLYVSDLNGGLRVLDVQF